MSDQFDRLENRTPTARENALFRDLRHVFGVAKGRVPALRAHLKGIDLASIETRAALAVLPLTRRADIMALQAAAPPLGNLVATRLGVLAKAFVTCDSAVSVEGQARDWWGVGRGLHAAGLRKGAMVFNCHTYDLVPDGHMFDAGARAVGCTVIPAGAADLARKSDAISRLRPDFFCGSAVHLKEILDFCTDRGIDTRCLQKAFVTGRMGYGLRSEFSLRGIEVKHGFVIPEIGLVAFESGATDGLIVNEGLLVEIVDPSTTKPVETGATGEIVVTRINLDYPLLRFATGLISRVLWQPSTCGRTNMRIATPQEPRNADCDTAPINQADIIEIAKQFPMLGRMRIILRRLLDRDELHLQAEHHGAPPALVDSVRAALYRVTATPGTVEFVEPGYLSDDDSVILDERSLH